MRDIDGCVWGATPDTVWVRAGLGTWRTMEIVAHECRHVWQRRRAGAWGRLPRDPAVLAAREADATAYGESVYRWFD